MEYRIAMAVDTKGKMNACGFTMPNGECSSDEAMDLAIDGVGEGESRYWITVDVPIPEVKEVAGEVEAA